MHLIASRTTKNVKQVVNRSNQNISIYSCDLYIDSFKLNFRGFVYFLWSTNTTQIQSLKYDSTGRQVQVKQTLTISVRLIIRNQREQQFTTTLYLMSDDGELDSYDLTINNWSSQFEDLELPLAKGLVFVKVRRKNIMLAHEEQQLGHRKSTQLYKSRGTKYDKMRIQQQKYEISHSIMGGQYESMQEELNRIKKELQDAIYMNNKLKNDREVLLAMKQESQIEMETLIVQITKQISIIKEHYQNRMTIRQHCYEEQIEEIVNTFNSTADQSKRVIDLVLKQKNKVQEEIRPLIDRNKKLQDEGISFKHELQKNKAEQLRLMDSISHLNEEISHRNIDIQQANRQLESKDEALQQQKQYISNLQNELQNRQKTIRQKQQTINQLINKNNICQKRIDESSIRISELQDQINRHVNIQKMRIQEKQLLQSQNGLLQKDKNDMANELEQYKAKMQEFEYQMEFNQNVITQLKNQQAQKEQQLYNQIQTLEKLYSKKMQEIKLSFESHFERLERQNEELKNQKLIFQEKIQSLNGHLEGSEIKMNQQSNLIQELKNELKKGGKSQSETKDQLLEAFQKQINKLKHQLAQSKQNQENFKNQLQNIHADFKQGSLKNSQKQSHKSLKFKNDPNLEQEIKILKLQIERLNIENENLLKEINHSQQKSPIKLQRLDSLASRKNYQQQNHENIEEIVVKKDIQIGQLRRRLDQLENLYNNLQIKIQKIVSKYPHVDIDNLDVRLPPAKVIEVCDSQVQQQKQINELIRKQSRKSINPIEQQNEDIISMNDSGHKITSNRISFQPRSEQRIKIEDQNKISQTQSRKLRPRGSINQNISIQVPAEDFINKKYNQNDRVKRQQSIGSYDYSEKSGTSYIKVSHAKKIKDLQSKIQQLIEKQDNYQKQIEGYLKHINGLEKQMIEMKNSLEKIKFETSSKGQNNSLNEPQNKSDVLQKTFGIKKQSKQSQAFFEDERLKNMMHESHFKDQQIAKFMRRIHELEDGIKNEHEESSKRILSLELKLSQMEKSQKQFVSKISNNEQILKKLQKQIEDYDEKLRKERQLAQQLKLTIKELNFHLENANNQLKKYKNLAENLEEKIQKMAANQGLVRQLSRQIEDLNKKSLEQIRITNHLKLQKDSLEQQIKILKKKCSDQSRTSIEWEQKSSSLERTIEQFKRKQNKYKRQVDDAQQQSRKLKTQIKKLEQEIQNLNTIQSGHTYEKKKHLDEIAQLQDQLNRKQYEYNRILKQLQKYKHRIEDNEDFRVGKKNELRYEIERLQSELIKRQKKIVEDTQEIKMLKSRLQFLERQNKKMMEQKNQSYGDKLKYYVDEIASIKKLLDEYQNQNTRLKIQNSAFYEQNQIIKLSFDKLQNKYEQNMENQQNILNDLQLYMNEVGMLKDKLKNYEIQLDRYESAYANLKKQANEEQLRGRKNEEKLQVSERNNERLLSEIKDLKLKLNQLQTSYDIYNKVNEKLKLSERKRSEIEEEYKRIKNQYENLVSVFIYKRDDLQKAVYDAKMHEKHLKQQEFKNLQSQYNKNLSTKSQRFQQQILDLYNENAKIRNQNQNLNDENGKMRQKIVQLEYLNQGMSQMQNQIQNLTSTINDLKEELKKNKQKLAKVQFNSEILDNQTKNKEKQNNKLKQAIQQLQQKLKSISLQNELLKKGVKELQQKLKQKEKKQSNEVNKNEQPQPNKISFQQTIQQYEMKLMQNDFQIQKLKDKQARIIEQNSNKIKNLQFKMDQMDEAMKEKQKALQSHYDTQIQSLEMTLMKLSQQLEDKMLRIEQLNEALIILQNENKGLAKQLENARYKLEEESEIFNIELNKIKNKLKDTEALYAAKLKQLEDELSRQLANSKQNNMSGSRLKANEIEEKINKRFEQKLKNKDRKIQQLKENIYTLEQTILKMRKKQTNYQNTNNEYQKLKSSYLDLQKELKSNSAKHDDQLNRQLDLVRELKKEILSLRQSEQIIKIKLEQKILENQSLSCELKTFRQLYGQLQKQLERRKTVLTSQMEEQSAVNHRLRLQETKIIQLEQKILQLTKSNKTLQLELKKKQNEIKKKIEQFEQLKQEQQKYKQQLAQLTIQINNSKTQLLFSNQSIQQAKNETKNSKLQMIRIKKLYDEAKINLQHRDRAIQQLNILIQNLTIKYKESEDTAQRYYDLNEQTRKQIGINIDDLINRYLQQMYEKDNEISQLAQENQELKFLNQRKYMDFDEMKKQNFELQLKVEDMDILNQQVDTLRKICDKLEDEKKNANFREEVMRMQVENLLVIANGSEMKNRIENILNSHTYGNYQSFGIY